MIYISSKPIIVVESIREGSGLLIGHMEWDGEFVTMIEIGHGETFVTSDGDVCGYCGKEVDILVGGAWESFRSDVIYHLGCVEVREDSDE